MIMKLLVVVSALFAIVNAGPVKESWTARTAIQPAVIRKTVGEIWTDCTKSDDRAKIDSVKITPDPPVKGQDVEIEATITLKEEVTGGDIEISIKAPLLPPISQTEKLCDLAEASGSKCPLAAGQHTFILKVEVPSLLLPGKYTGNAVAIDQDGNELICVDIELRF